MFSATFAAVRIAAATRTAAVTAMNGQQKPPGKGRLRHDNP